MVKVYLQQHDEWQPFQVWMLVQDGLMKSRPKPKQDKAFPFFISSQSDICGYFPDQFACYFA